MKCTWTLRLLAAALCATPVVATAQLTTHGMVPVAGTVLAPSPMKAVLWTDKLGYGTSDQMKVYATMDSMGRPGSVHSVLVPGEYRDGRADVRSADRTPSYHF